MCKQSYRSVHEHFLRPRHRKEAIRGHRADHHIQNFLGEWPKHDRSILNVELNEPCEGVDSANVAFLHIQNYDDIPNAINQPTNSLLLQLVCYSRLQILAQVLGVQLDAPS